MSAVLGIKEQAVLISLLKREIARIEAKEIAFRIQTKSPYIYCREMRDLVGKPTSEEIETKNICQKILDDVVEKSMIKKLDNDNIDFDVAVAGCIEPWHRLTEKLNEVIEHLNALEGDRRWTKNGQNLKFMKSSEGRSIFSPIVMNM